ncbi:uncharacterized protein LOC130527120 isoform X2 [Takifugu flavidus]|uniref:uncharacterized protein LOC130527120 isoform X2 n=1 Tax=Takifugu flavidus TaxID=433684 RepID=UPI0025440768|nr:uncharacterized protein LOC130527120 isoform X2 [Takifugu flavidus]
MTRSTLIKLLLLMILAFIICLPEFFTLYRALKVKLTCLPYRPCGGGNEVAGSGDPQDSNRRTETCDPSQTQEREKWEQLCTKMDPERASSAGTTDQEHSWFRCETNMDLTELHTNSSPSALQLEVSMELQFKDVESLNLTLWGLRNHDSLHLHPPKEEDEDKGWNVEEGGEVKAFYCCCPAPVSSESTTQSHCLLWLPNQTALRGAAHHQLPLADKEEWCSAVRVLWLVLLCVVLLVIFTTIIRQICVCKKPKICPVGENITGTHLNELSPIHEVPSQDETETLLDGNNEQSFTANLHHRCHHTFPLDGRKTDRCERQMFH